MKTHTQSEMSEDSEKRERPMYMHTHIEAKVMTVCMSILFISPFVGVKL